MNFDFPTLIVQPLVRIDHTKLKAKDLQKKIEDQLTDLFKKTKQSNKMYLLHFTEQFLEVQEFTDDSYIIPNYDLLCEAFYDPLGNVFLSYLKMERTKFQVQLNELKNN